MNRWRIAASTLVMALAVPLAGHGTTAAQADGLTCEGRPVTHVMKPGKKFVGTWRDDVVWGTNKRDVVDGRDGNDWICGRGGNDVIDGDDGHDRIWGGKGRDTVDGGRDNDKVVGGAGNDVLRGGPGKDVVEGDSGHDELWAGGLQRAWLTGGTGNDELHVDSTSVEAKGGSGNDTIDVTGEDATVWGGKGRDVVRGFGDAMTVHAGPGKDTVWGSAEDDVIDAGSGDDEVNGAAGSDTITGGRGRDHLITGSFGPRDVVNGGTGNDRLEAGSRGSVLFGGDDHDTLTASAASTMNGGFGRDTITGSRYDDRIVGGPANDVLKGQGGEDSIDGNEGVDRCDGGAGTDACNGGAPGTILNTPTDPDICVAESMASCRGGAPAGYTGTASGTVTYGGGVTETWSATYRIKSVEGNDDLLDGSATFTWKIGGTDTSGCTYKGGASVAGDAEAALFRELGDYSMELRTHRDRTVPVEVTCPPENPRTVQMWPLNTDAASSALTPLPTNPRTLTGSRTYHPLEQVDVTSSWRWSAAS